MAWIYTLCCLLLLVLPAHSALLFDGVDDRVVTTNVTGAPTGYPLTVALVMRFTAVDMPIWQCGLQSPASGYSMVVGGTGGLAVINAVGSVAIESTVNMPTNTWLFAGWSSLNATTHRLYVYNYETQQVVVNQTFATNLGAITTPATNCTFGVVQSSAGTFTTSGNFPGTLTWIAFYTNTDFSGFGGNAFQAMTYLGPYSIANPSFLYTFQEMAGTVVQERSGTGNSGTMTNFPGAPWQPMSLPGPLPW
jgi:hypothetical protein